MDHWENLSEVLNRCLLLKESREESGIYGIGLKIDTARTPYVVKEGSMIFDENGKSINDSVNVGDTISSIDGYPMEKVGTEMILAMIVNLTRNKAKFWVISRNLRRLYSLREIFAICRSTVRTLLKI